MAVFEVFSHPLVIRYKTSVFSKSSCFFAATCLLTLIIPFFIAYYTQGFWKKIDVYREQPDVSFKHKMLLVLETKSPEELIFWSTYPKLNRFISPQLQTTMPSIEHREEDFNMDGKRDQLQMTIDVPVVSQEIVSVKLILVFDYKLRDYSEFNMESAAYIHYSTSLGGSALSAFGELSLQQREPLRHSGYDKRYNSPVIDVSANSHTPTRLEDILLAYLKRNISTSFRNAYYVWEAGPAVNESFKINLVILYPEETVFYKPGFWQLLKYALVQYVVLFIICSYIFSKIKLYVYQNQLIPTIIIHPIKPKHL